MERHDNIDTKTGVALFLRVLAYAKPYGLFIFIAILSIVAVTVLNLLEPFLIKVAIDECILKNDLDRLLRISLYYLAAIFLSFVFTFAQEYSLSITGQKIIYGIRKDVYHHIASRSTQYFDNSPIGRLTTRATNDIENLNEMYTALFVSFFQDFFMIIGIFILMLSQSLKLSSLCIFVIPPMIFFTIRFRFENQPLFRKARAVLAAINASLNEYISGMTVIQTFKKETVVYDKFKRKNEEYFEINNKQTRAMAMFRPSIELLRYVAMALLIFFGGKFVLEGSVEFGTLFMFTSLIGRFFKPILDLTEKYNILQAAISSSERIFTVLDDKREIPNPPSPVPMKNFKGKIEFKNVWFAYNDEDWVLKDISFIINPGESAAFVGATGAGKSSIINLITRFYDCQRGEILIDGVDIKKLDKHELRKNISVVQQEVFLFSGTISDNIRLFDKKITDNTVKSVSEYVNASKFIEKLPKGYEETITEKGATLSAGERQLLSFARTLAHEPLLLVLDEATANIDTETELLIKDALGKILKDRTAIAVAHRLSTIQNADKIIVLKQGRIIEEGNNETLLALKGTYYDLYKLQYKD